MSVNKLVLCALLLSPWSVFAQEQWLVGAGVVFQPNPFLKKSTTVLPVPMAEYQGEKMLLQLGRLRYVMSKAGRWDIFGQAAIRFEGFDTEDRNMQGMKERKPALEAGAGIARSNIGGTVEFGFRHDLVNSHRGYSVDARYDFTIGDANLLLQPRVGISYRSRRLVNYYYGVDAAEANANRPAYRGDYSVNVFIGGQTLYKLRTRLWATVGMQVERLGSSIQDSPIIDKSYQVSGHIGLIYAI